MRRGSRETGVWTPCGERSVTSRTGFFHASRPRATGQSAMAATFMRADNEEGPRRVRTRQITSKRRIYS